MAEARRGISMARLMIDGGFPEEVPALLAKSLSKLASVGAAQESRGPLDMARVADSEIRRFVDMRIWPPDALRLSEALQPSADEPDAKSAEALLATLGGLLDSLPQARVAA